MPRKKASTAVAPRKSTDLASLQAELSAEASSIIEQIGKPATNKISIKDKQFTLPDKTVLGDTMECVILDFVNRNEFYKGRWDPKNPAPPDCVAAAKKIEDLAPFKDSPDMQADSCDECMMNQFGSNGDAKACKNTFYLAVRPLDSEDDMIMTLSVPPTSLKNFKGFVQKVAKLYNLPPIGVVTRIGFNQDSTYSMLTFEDVEPNSALADHATYRDQAADLLLTAPDFTMAGVSDSKTRVKAKSRSRGRAA